MITNKLLAFLCGLLMLADSGVANAFDHYCVPFTSSIYEYNADYYFDHTEAEKIAYPWLYALIQMNIYQPFVDYAEIEWNWVPSSTVALSEHIYYSTQIDTYTYFRGEGSMGPNPYTASVADSEVCTGAAFWVLRW